MSTPEGVATYQRWLLKGLDGLAGMIRNTAREFPLTPDLKEQLRRAMRLLFEALGEDPPPPKPE